MSLQAKAIEYYQQKYPDKKKSWYQRKANSKIAAAAIPAAIPPALAGLFKTFTYSFGQLTFFLLVTTGTVGVTVAFLSTPFLPIAILMGFSVGLISWGMEGLALFQKIFRRSKSVKKFDKQNEKNHQQQNLGRIILGMLGLSFLLKKNDAEKIQTKIEKLTEKLKQTAEYKVIDEAIEVKLKQGGHRARLARFVGGVIQASGVLIAFTSGAVKGMSGAAATVATMLFLLNVAKVISAISITAATAASPPILATLILGAIGALVLAGVSWGKEGHTFWKHSTKFKRYTSMKILKLDKETLLQERADKKDDIELQQTYTHVLNTIADINTQGLVASSSKEAHWDSSITEVEPLLVPSPGRQPARAATRSPAQHDFDHLAAVGGQFTHS